MILRKNQMISPKKFFFPPEESRNSPGGIEKFLRWNRRVPPLELKSSKRETVFGTRMRFEYSTIQRATRLDVLPTKCVELSMAGTSSIFALSTY